MKLPFQQVRLAEHGHGVDFQVELVGRETSAVVDLSEVTEAKIADVSHDLALAPPEVPLLLPKPLGEPHAGAVGGGGQVLGDLQRSDLS